MEKLIQNRNPDQDQSTDRIPNSLPPNLILNPSRCICLVRRRAGREDGLTQASGNIREQCVEQREVVHSGEGLIK